MLFFFPSLVSPWITSEFSLQMMNQLVQCKYTGRNNILLSLTGGWRRGSMLCETSLRVPEIGVVGLLAPE